MELLLTEIALEGFKSFKDKTVFKFDGPLTAVVGPNGSGKSNVVDAIKWILGDPSPRSIRAATGLEAIYRPADGNGESSGFASVAIKIDNSGTDALDEPAEWEIERRYYRSGESVYTVNGKTARLKDIRAIMARKGFGLGNLSVVGQGEIDGFLSLMPYDRRLVFEDLARISDFKANKRKILNQLTESARNYERLKDLIGEMLVRVDSLEVQAEAAKKYSELTLAKNETEAQFAAQEYLLALRNHDRNVSRLGELKKELENIRLARDEAVGNFQRAKTNLENARAENAETLQESEKGRRDLDHAVAEERRLTDANKHISTLIGTLENELTERDNRVGELNKRLAELEETTENAVTEFVDHHRRRMDLDIYLSRKWGHTRCYERERERLAGRVERLQGEGSLFARDAEFHTRRAESYKSEIGELLDKKVNLEGEKVNLETSKADIRKEYDRLKDLETNQGKAISEINEKLQNLGTEHSKAIDKQRDIESEIKALDNERIILEELEIAKEGYGEGTRAVLENRESFPGLRGTPGELIDVTPGHETAIECVLGDSIQYLVIDTLDQALEIIAKVKSDRLGSVTCIVRDLVPEYSDEGNPAGLMDLINYCRIDNELKPVLGLLLSGATEIQNTVEIQNSGLSKVLVSSDGILFRPPAYVSGGSGKSAAQGILTRRARLQEIEVELNRLNPEEVEIKSELSNLEQSISSEQSTLADLKSNLVTTEEEIRTNISVGEQTVQKIEQCEFNLTEIKDRMGDLESERDGCVENARLASQGIEVVKRARNEAEISLGKIERKIPSLRAMVDDLRSRLQRAIVMEASYREEAERAGKESRRIREELGTLSKMSGEKKQRLDDVRNEALGTSDELDRAIKLRNELGKKLPELERKEKEARDNIKKFLEIVTEAEEKVEESRESVNTAENALHNQEVRLAELSGGLRSLERSLEEYPEFAERVRKGEMGGKDIPSKKELNEKLGGLLAELETLGTVNPLAIEEEKAARTRMEELQKEREDLILAEGELRKALEEVEEQSEKAFVTTFKLAQEKFSETFESLFPGGTGELSLTDPTDPLESGIDVRIKFPGKGELDLLQLSGGERALIALALLFAILKVKPSSFTVLDEVEAALDDVNTQKFLDYLQKEFIGTQFILITHNKITMERADRLYGVTMHSGGISQVVSVDFKSLKEKEVDELLGVAS